MSSHRASSGKEPLVFSNVTSLQPGSENFLPSSAHQFVANQYSQVRKDEGAYHQHTKMMGYAGVDASVQAHQTLQSSYNDTQHNPVSAITSQDGKVTINITQGSVGHHHKNRRPPHRSSKRDSHKKSDRTTTHVDQTLSERDPDFHKKVGDSSQAKSSSSKHRHHRASDHHSKSGSDSAIPFRQRKSQRNLADAMDAADSAMAVFHTGRGKPIAQTPIKEDYAGEEMSSKDHKTSHEGGIQNSSLASCGVNTSRGLNANEKAVAASNGVSDLHRNAAFNDSAYYNDDTIDEELNKSLYQGECSDHMNS